MVASYEKEKKRKEKKTVVIAYGGKV